MHPKCVILFEPLERRVLLSGTMNLLQYVNPFIGTELQAGATFGAGNTFPGAVYPFGMVQWSPDTPTSYAGGYHYTNTSIKGFSITHFSGRGLSYLQDVPITPFVGTVTTSPASGGYGSTFSHAYESASPGYYQVRLGSGVNVELTTTLHTGLGTFTFPATPSATLLFNTSGSVNGATSAVNIVGNDVLTGSATSHIGGSSKPYTIYFYAQFDRPFASFGTWNGSVVSNGSNSNSGAHAGGFVSFDASTNPIVHLKVGLSYVSVANARLNLTSENPGWDFTAVRQAASDAWNARLNEIQVEGGTVSDKTAFYTALYHTMIHPNVFSDVNGQYIGFDNQIHTVAAGRVQYENITTWDNYRSEIRLLALLAPDVTGDIAQSLINDAQQGNSNALPRWEQGNADSRGMVGDGADVDLASAYALGATNFDTMAALQLMNQGATNPSHTVRDNLADYLSLGYVASDHNGGSAAVTLEYTNDDFAIAQLAASLGNTALSNTYLARAQDWKALFDAATGYITPKDSTGNFMSGFSPTSETGFVEGDAAQYTWMVPFNYAGLFDRMGGNAAAVARLDTFWTQLNGGITSPFGFMGNEPCEEAPWAYDFAGAPWRTQDVVRRIELQLFTNSPAGLPGNDDAGALSSWLVFADIGLYPDLPGVGGFAVGSPLFSSITLNLPGHTVQINAPAASDGNPYVQGMKVNGAPTTSLWLPVSTLLQNANTSIDFALSNLPDTSWGNTPGDALPSFDTTGPRVTAVRVSGSSWTVAPYSIPSGPMQLTDLPWGNIDRVQVQFSEPAVVSAPSLALTGVSVPSYAVKSFNYDPNTFTATWVLNEPIGADRLQLSLSGVTDSAGTALQGQWTDGVSSFPSGNGSPGGAFAFHFSVLPGDVNGDGAVDFADLVTLARDYGHAGGPTDGDLTGDGLVNFADFVLLARNYGRHALTAAVRATP